MSDTDVPDAAPEPESAAPNTWIQRNLAGDVIAIRSGWCPDELGWIAVPDEDLPALQAEVDAQGVKEAAARAKALGR